MTVPLVIDIETARTAATVEDTIANMQLVDRVDSRLRDEAKIAAAWTKKATEAGLDASHGRVVAIGWQYGNHEPACMIAENPGRTPETVLLAEWVQVIDNARGVGTGNIDRVTLVGHCLADFDLPFLWRRMVINGLKPPHWLPGPAMLKPWSETVFDTSVQWAGNKSHISLKKLAWTLGAEGKIPGMDGSKVQELVDAGEWEKIREYCLQDVRTTRAIYDRMTSTN